MRIYMVATVLAPIGGIEAALIPLVHQLKADNHEVIVYVIEPVAYPNQNAEALKESGIPLVVSYPWLTCLAAWLISRKSKLIDLINSTIALLLFPFVVLDALRKKRSLPRAFKGVKGRLNPNIYKFFAFKSLYYLRLNLLFLHNKPDIVHIHGWGCGEDPPGCLNWLQNKNIKTVYTEHNSPDLARQERIKDAPMNAADLLIAVSNAGRQGLMQVGGASRPIIVIPYSIQPIPVLPRDGNNATLTITSLARLSPQKDHATLLIAMKLVASDTPVSQLILAGDGPLRNQLQSLTQKLNLSQNVTFLGVVTHDQIPSLLSKTDIFVLDSLWEGLPVSLIEAMSAEKPIVASDVGGNPELVQDGVNGLIVPPSDPIALAHALIYLLSDPGLRRKMGEASGALFKKGGFSPEEVAEQHLSAYQQALNLA